MIEERYKEALEKKKNDIKSFVWKGKKVIKNGEIIQDEKRLVDCSDEELKSFYTHCESMLYNNSKDNPGRYVVLELIHDQISKCNAELFIRWLEKSRDTSRFVFLTTLRDLLNNNPQIDPKENTVAIAVGDCPKEFQNIKINTALEACLDTLGKFSKSHITLSFLLKQGVYLTEDDLKNIPKNANKVEYIRGCLDLKPTVNIYVSSKGLTLDQMKAMITLRNRKYSELSTTQLETLRNRILFALEDDVRTHIKQWEERERQIKLVLKSRGISIGNDGESV
ncbi:hypothetical protein [Lachnospira sp.]|jgi:hypothetical protein|uniref:hypothetical protein n=1 Tax=Lachnospira sp. TaxID=2049031 RepID=UPI0025794CAE|nr:hypothetical protein [Lachnospira sp.]